MKLLKQISVVGAVSLLTLGLFSSSTAMAARLSSKADAKENACDSLNIKFGNVYKIRSGFYEGKLLRITAESVEEFAQGDIVDHGKCFGTVFNMFVECSYLETASGEF